MSAQGWELVGGPACGEVVATEYDYPIWRVVKAPPVSFVPPTCGEDVLDLLPVVGEYRCDSMADRTQRVLRWQGWKR